MISDKPPAKGNFVYIVQVTHAGESWFKVGKATNWKARISSVQTGCPIEFCRILVGKVSDEANSTIVENQIHVALATRSHAGEWFTGIADETVLAAIGACLVRHGVSIEWFEPRKVRLNGEQCSRRAATNLARAEAQLEVYRARDEQSERWHKEAQAKRPLSVGEISIAYRRRHIEK